MAACFRSGANARCARARLAQRERMSTIAARTIGRLVEIADKCPLHRTLTSNGGLKAFLSPSLRPVPREPRTVREESS
jgi:hypothetical protein